MFFPSFSIPLASVSLISCSLSISFFSFSNIFLKISQVVLTSAQTAFSELAKQHPVIAALFDSRSSDEVSASM